MPTPRENETQQEFVSRCIIDPESIQDFPDREQRLAFCYSQFDRYKSEYIKKDFVDDWRSAFSKRLGRAENRLVARLKRFYKRNYFQAIDTFIQTNNIQTEGIFKTDDWKNIYIAIYTDIGMDFAKWYANNFRRYIPKSFDSEKLEDVFQQAFNAYALQHAGTQIVLVQGTALETLKKILQRRLQDPEFNSLGERERARILRSEFTRYSDFQARRLVRTEATNAANLGVEKGATTLFPPDQLNKRWITARDGRVRSFFEGDKADHVEMERHPDIPFDGFFDVPTVFGSDKMRRPGDPSGTAANRINCRCGIIPIPIEGAQAREGLTGVGVGLSGAGTSSIV